MLTPTEPSTAGARCIIDAIREAAHQHPETAVIVHSATHPTTTNLGEVFDESCRFAANLATLGIRPGDVVAVQLPNWRECFVAHAAVWMLGAVLLPIVPIYGPREVRYILEESKARAFITARSAGGRDAASTLDAAADLPALSHRIIVGGGPSSALPYADLTAGTAADFTPYQRAESHQDCLLVYTSGTTAQPKGVVHSHASLLSEMLSIEQMRGGAPSLTTLLVLPPGHIAGVLGLLRMLSQPNTTVVLDAWNAETAARLIAAHRVGSSAGAPIHLSGILDVAERDRLDMSSLSEYTTGAANVTGNLIRRADAWGIRAFRCYGSTEHPTISACSPEDPLDKRADTDGRLTPGTQVRIVGDDGDEVPRGGEGEILSRGPELFTRYTDIGATQAAMIDGWFRTGDVGRLDAEGYLTITDRKKDVIIRGGENISSKEVEEALCAHPAVLDAAAIGVFDNAYGQRVCAFVVLAPGSEFTAAEAAAHFSRCGMARQKAPERIVVVAELPRTAAGKVQKHLLRH
jgi:cyclohexanecarboxylate-CoA ligase